MWILSLGWEDPLEEGKWQPTAVFLPGESQGQRSPAGYRIQRAYSHCWIAETDTVLQRQPERSEKTDENIWKPTVLQRHMWDSTTVHRERTHTETPHCTAQGTRFHQLGALQSLSRVRPHGPQHARPPCPSAAPAAYWNSCPRSRRCRPVIKDNEKECGKACVREQKYHYAIQRKLTWNGKSTTLC